ncbi:MAG: hypothetical protein MZW92_03100 [Comamonadaceae bacterium]|nr:hypothetical protein [Comamonadaceae bacterium]
MGIHLTYTPGLRHRLGPGQSGRERPLVRRRPGPARAAWSGPTCAATTTTAC